MSACAGLSQQQRELMRRAAGEFYETLEIFAGEGRHPITDILAAEAAPFTRLVKYPEDCVGDAADQFCWFYHAHEPTPSRSWEENGHFHCFAYTELVPEGVAPMALPDDADPIAGGLVHLLGLCVSASGVPDRLFTINRWLSDEWLYPAPIVAALASQFQVTSDTRFALTSRWLGSLLRILTPQIASLLQERDRALDVRRKSDPKGFSEDPSSDILSTLDFDLDACLSEIDARA